MYWNCTGESGRGVTCIVYIVYYYTPRPEQGPKPHGQLRSHRALCAQPFQKSIRKVNIRSRHNQSISIYFGHNPNKQGVFSGCFLKEFTVARETIYKIAPVESMVEEASKDDRIKMTESRRL